MSTSRLVVKNTFLEVSSGNKEKRARSFSPGRREGEAGLGKCSLSVYKLSDAGAWDVFLGKVQGDYVPLEATIEARDCFDESGIPDVQQGGIKAVCRAGSSAVGVDLSVRPVDEFFDIASLRDAWEPLSMHRTIEHVISQLNQLNNYRFSGGQW